MNSIAQNIQNMLNSGNLANNLMPLFCQTLNWGAPKRMSTRMLPVGAPVNADITAQPVAQISGLPVYSIIWKGERLPGITARRAVHRVMKPIHAEHLLCFITENQKQASFVWARSRADGKTELRALPYEVGSPARTTIEQLSKLAFNLEELEQGEPQIAVLIDKLHAAFNVEAVTEEFFEDYKKVFANLQEATL